MSTDRQKPRRLDQLLSRCGYCSRSEARDWVRQGRVTIEGKRAEGADDKAEPAVVRIDGEPMEHPDGLLVLLHKPANYVCSHDEREGPTIYDLLPARWARRNPAVTSIGRLDRDATGVLLITDDGALVQRWTSPRHKVPKLYEVTVDGVLKPEFAAVFAAGTLQLEGEDQPCRPATLQIRGPHEATLEIVEGRYHQVKRMFASQGCPVTRLHRSRFGDYDVQGLRPGEYKILPLPGFA